MPRWEPNARVRLVEAAVDLFSEQGYEATSVAEIAARAGLTKTTFFRHFPDKREVLSAGQESHSDLLSTAIGAARAEATPMEAVGAAVNALAASFEPERRGFAGRLQEVIAANPELQERTTFKRAGYAATLERGLAARGVDAASASVAAGLGILAFTLAFADWASGEDRRELPELTRAHLEELRSASVALR